MGKFAKENLPDPPAFYAGEGLTLKGRGLWRTTSCPFHGGSNSLRVNAESGGFKCMNCGVHGGDVVSFLMQRDSTGFTETTRKLGAWIEDGKPDHARSAPLPLPPRQLIDLTVAKARIAWIVAGDLRRRCSRNDLINPEDFDSFTDAVAALERIATIR